MRIKRDKLDIMVSRFVKLRDKWCQRCGGSGGLQTSHFWGRAKKSVRWDEENICLLCFGCHQYFHANPAEHTEFFKKRLGPGYDLLLVRARTPVRNQDKSAIGLYYKEQIKEMENESY